MKTSSRRYRRHRNPEKTDQQEGPFFSPTSKAIQTKEDAFFQPKLTVGEPGDQYEKEADAVADKVVNKQPARSTAVQRKEISAVQAMPEKKEEEKPVQKKGMNDKKEEEKPVQKKDDKGKEEEKLQKKSAPDKKEEEKAVQKKDDKGKEEEKLQKKSAPDKKEEEKPVQKKGDMGKEEEKLQKKEEPEKKPAADEVLKEEKEEEKKGGGPSLMAKENNSSGAREGSDQLAQQLKDQRGDGAPLSREMLNEMSNSIGADFSNVRIHTGEKAAALSSEIGAQAFTHGNDVYFNSGKYDTDSSAGKHLLAHELTHVVQQGAAPAVESRKATAPAAHSAPGVQREISTPLPEGVEPNKKSKIAKFPIGDFTVVVKPDRKATKADKVPADQAKTNGYINTGFSLKYDKKKMIESVTISKKLTIQTIYGKKATSSDDSAYGRGHIKADKDAGHKSLGFHEGSHGTDFINYVQSHPFPEIVIDTPVTMKEFKELKKQWKDEFKAYVDDMHSTSKTATDDVTDPVVPATP
ncbi:eCIS core domain-containing protein [Chitinophaga filiformis]|uniref:eCIS core domain-containing protein n=1 Tax=Chitinophaga filiformis TaxID=104663 RepID=A0A1G7P5V3_CHIFI|nr:DUF4157 domain-containing protein [Chitinophaga filiformis]SDF80820.1 protein of unknown function [Chitinophaga filiformis]